jgi:hypothetical protein
MYTEYSRPHIPAGLQVLPVGATAVKLTVPTGSRYAEVRVLDNDVRFRDDATASSTTGYLVKKEEEIELVSREQLAAFNVASTGGTASLEIRYYKI